jgi:hypothetical protein
LQQGLVGEQVECFFLVEFYFVPDQSEESMDFEVFGDEESRLDGGYLLFGILFRRDLGFLEIRRMTLSGWSYRILEEVS